MKQEVKIMFDGLFKARPELITCKYSIEKAFEILKQCYSQGGKVLICGNGGSAADSEHIVGELMKGFLLKRKICENDEKRLKAAFPDDGEYLSKNLQGTLSAISLVSQTSIASAFINDVAADMVYAQLVYGYVKEGDVLIGLSTSGNSCNVVNALKVGKAFGAMTIGMTGESGGKMKDLCDVDIMVPSNMTYKVQEYHLPVYHVLCAMIEAEFFAD